MSIEYHRNMLADHVRIDAFRRALQETVRTGETVVADIGSGTGILGFLARQLGATEVHMYECADVINLSRLLARENRIKNCHFHHAHSTAVRNPAPADLIVCETLGNYALEENIIATVEDAKRFLRPGGIIIPQKIEQFVAPVVTGRFYDELRIWDHVGYGLDYSAAREMSLNNIYVRTFAPEDLASRGQAARLWDTVDFRGKNASARKGTAEWEITGDDMIYGFAVWWRCELTPGIELSTAPGAPPTHWEQLFFPVREPVQARAGDRLSVALASRSSYEDGTTIRWSLTLRRADGGRTEKQAMDLADGFLA